MRVFEIPFVIINPLALNQASVQHRDEEFWYAINGTSTQNSLSIWVRNKPEK